MAEKRFQIFVMTCAESGVLVGTSPDIPGLTLEADSREQLLAAVSDVVPQLLTHNLKLPEDQLAECVVEVTFTNPNRPELDIVVPSKIKSRHTANSVLKQAGLAKLP